MKKHVDVGLDYIMDLKFSGARNGKQLEQKLVEILGEDIGNKAIYHIYENYDRNQNHKDKINFYNFKNQNLKTSLTISSLFDSDIYRKSCNWIYENRNYFGKSILDVGCDNGIMTCFIAKIMPYSHIIGIDRSQNAIKVAEEFANKMNIKNISFICSDIKDLKLDEEFDTVFSMRTMNENDSKYTNYPYFTDIKVQGEYFADSLAEYSNSINRFISDAGNFICLEKCDLYPKLLGWYWNFNKHGMSVVQDVHKELEVNEVGAISKLRANIFIKDHKNSKPDVFNYWVHQVMKDADRKAASYNSWQAEALLSTEKGDLIEGCYFLNNQFERVYLLGIWKSLNASDTILFYCASFEENLLGLYDLNREEELKDYIKNKKDEAIKTGFRIEPLKE